jgi:ATP-dependent DNA helicase RecQ
VTRIAQSAIGNRQLAIGNCITDLLAEVQRHWPEVVALRPLQSEALHAVLSGRDLLAVMPTGLGKSLCYQFPAASEPRPSGSGGWPITLAVGDSIPHSGPLTVVITPTISLMDDQVASLTARGIPAASIHSLQQSYEQIRVASDVIDGKLRLLYVSPERAAQPYSVALLKRVHLRNFVIDEAHCISQWGHDFRPDYRRLAELRVNFPRTPIHCFTATARPEVREDICDLLSLRAPDILVGDVFRPNLHLSVLPRDSDAQLLAFVRSHGRVAHRFSGGELDDQTTEPSPGIVYCLTRSETVRIAGLLNRAGINAIWYHGGPEMDPAARRRAHHAWRAGRADVVVATIAFGLGVDRPDVRWVALWGMPSSLEVYHQECGRAGRDGRAAECVLFYHESDFDFWSSLFESEQRRASDPSRACEEAVLSSARTLEPSNPATLEPLTNCVGADGPNRDSDGAACSIGNRQLAIGNWSDLRLDLLDQMTDFCDDGAAAPWCRHAELCEYFAQSFPAAPCGSCDMCKGMA